MNTNNLLALLLGLQKVSPELINKSILRKIANLIEFKATPEKIQAQIDIILSESPKLKQSYQVIKTNLDGVTIPDDILPSEAEIQAFLLPQEAIRAGKPGINKGNNNEITNILKVSKVILNHENPPEASKTLLKQFNEW